MGSPGFIFLPPSPAPTSLTCLDHYLLGTWPWGGARDQTSWGSERTGREKSTPHHLTASTKPALPVHRLFSHLWAPLHIEPVSPPRPDLTRRHCIHSMHSVLSTFKATGHPQLLLTGPPTQSRVCKPHPGRCSPQPWAPRGQCCLHTSGDSLAPGITAYGRFWH